MLKVGQKYKVTIVSNPIAPLRKGDRTFKVTVLNVSRRAGTVFVFIHGEIRNERKILKSLLDGKYTFSDYKNSRWSNWDAEEAIVSYTMLDTGIYTIFGTLLDFKEIK